MSNRSITTKDIAYIAICAALTLVFRFAGNLIPFLDMPNGGSIEIELIILFFASFTLGCTKGIITALVYWVLCFIMHQADYFVNVPQYLLDYILPFVMVGAASFFTFNVVKNEIIRVDIAVAIAMVLKYLSNVLSGVYFWFPEGESAGSLGAWVYSLSYNLWYNLVTMIVCLIVVPLIVTRLAKRIK